MSSSDALHQAQSRGLDLVEVSPNAKPPVVKIVDYGKYKYQQEKKKKDNKKASKQKEMKEMRFGLKIGENDMDIKLNKVRNFLIDGHKVKISAVFKGREMAHREIGYQVLDRIQEKLGDIIVVEQNPVMAGRRLGMTVRPNPKGIKEYLANLDKPTEDISVEEKTTEEPSVEPEA